MNHRLHLAVLALILTFPGWAAAQAQDPTVITTEIVITSPGNYPLGPYVSPANPLTLNLPTFTQSGIDGHNPYAGTWTATMFWSSGFQPTFTDSWGNGTPTGQWSLSTPIPEITPITGDALTPNTSWQPGTVLHTLNNVPIRLILYDDYNTHDSAGNVNGTQSPPYTNSDRFGPGAFAEVTMNPPGTPASAKQLSVVDGGYETSSGLVGQPLDISSLFNFPAGHVAMSWSINITGPDVENSSLLFTNGNKGLNGVNGAISQGQICVVSYPPPTATVTQTPLNGSNAAPGEHIYFDPAVQTFSVNITELYPVNWTWVQVTAPDTKTYYVWQPGNSGTANQTVSITSALSASGQSKLSTTAPSASGQPTATTTNAGQGAGQDAVSMSTDPSLTISFSMADLMTGMGQSALPAGQYSIQVVTYTPCCKTNSGGWGADSISTPVTFYYDPNVAIHTTGVTTGS